MISRMYMSLYGARYSFFCLEFPCFVYDIILEFRSVNSNFLVKDGSFKTSIDSILLNLSNRSFVALIFLVISSIGSCLKAITWMNRWTFFLFTAHPRFFNSRWIWRYPYSLCSPRMERISSFSGYSWASLVHFFCQNMKVDFGKEIA